MALEFQSQLTNCRASSPDPLAFSKDRIHEDYDAAAAHRFWRALVQVDRVLKQFRSGFLGKASPVQFRGSFDLAVTRFSGGRLHAIRVVFLGCQTPGARGPIRMRSAAPDSGRVTSFPRAAFYSYAYPEPDRFRNCQSLKVPITMARSEYSYCRTTRFAALPTRRSAARFSGLDLRRRRRER